MSKIGEFLKEAGVFFLATNDGDQPKLRPLGAFLDKDGKVIFGVGDFKDVYKQLLANPKCEIAACKKDGHWLRYTGKAVFETDGSYAEEMIKAAHLEMIYNETTGNKLMAFHLEDAKAVDIAIMGEGVSLL
ncbi:MAG: pyridoxamine 5'-phosphate oxidase family protein [Ruminococcus sp.]|nr:pyridoxamine 5'-phosphate oxidase family protein [Ruminococcus sp.]MBR5165137.1 pyridoxamine 5'-phosphate oxidase family protein [Ruminococcus sp.]MCR5016273.1 pyridoxamine 5'-phosphate oxidase family protein [Ruminococcus sp.]